MARTLVLALCTGLTLAAPTAALAADKGGDPKGNNGTVKIGAVPLDKAPHANQPHVGCSFSLRFFGFDKDQTADITFTGQAPTKAGTLLTQTAVPISDDAAGGGQDADAVLTYTASQLGLTGVAPAKQGWHVKVAVDVREAPGGAKQKVFWLQCPPPSRTTTPSTSGSGTTSTASGSTSSSGSTTSGSTTSGSGTTSSGSAVSSGEAVSSGGAVSSGQAVSSGTTTSAATAPRTSANSVGKTYGSGVLSETATAPASASSGGGIGRGLLPFTGDHIADLFWGALAALGLGGVVTAAARRRHV